MFFVYFCLSLETLFREITIIMETIHFNKPWLTGKESDYISQSLQLGKTCGNGKFTHLCEDFFEKKLGARKCLLTTSCTDALEMCAMLAGIEPGDEVIVPSYTFVSTALAFARQGATIVFADSSTTHPDIDTQQLEALITPRTKAIVPIHYAGVACDMDAILEVANRHNLWVIEDAAQAIDSFYKGRPLGTLGHLAAFSFHETKNIQCGEGGLLVINDEKLVKRAEVLWEKGTNRAEFFRGEVNKYGWVDTGSSFLPAEYVAAFLWAQIEEIEQIQQKRKALWERYNNGLKDIKGLLLPFIPAYATNNAHAFYIVCSSLEERTALIAYLKENNIHAVFHYLSLHKSPYAVQRNWDKASLPQADRYTDCLLRLPLFYELTTEEVDYICHTIRTFYHSRP